MTHDDLERSEWRANARKREALGLALKLIRTERNLKQYELARRAALDRTHLAHFEHGRRTVDDEDLAALAAALDVTVATIRRLAAALESGALPWGRMVAA